MIYLGLERVQPIVRTTNIQREDLHLSSSEIAEIETLYKSILLKDYFGNITGISTREKKNTLAILPEDRSLEMISSGEDNIGQILLSLFSFKKLKESNSEYQGGILLIDEIDATLYQAAQNKLMDAILDLDTRFGIQVFATTHSLSLIEHTLNYKTKKHVGYWENDVSVFSLKNEGNPSKLTVTSNPSAIALENKFFLASDEDLTRACLKKKKCTKRCII